ncbi:hypothetical protein C8J57DRAFT_1292048 [Mycena rebaudengoi]|nr:hypothetical protein C8J57DRAFT_1292048 [Mycena rebaudengoi]
MFFALWSLPFLLLNANAQYSATYLPENAPDKTENGQTGTNRCGTALNQTSMCQNAYMNALDDWCLWAPPTPGAGSVIGNTERIEVAWCLKSGTGARLIPDGAITGAHWRITPDYIQVTGIGNMSFLNIPAGDQGGELDPHGADGNGNPIGGLVFSTAFGKMQQIFEWTNFMGAEQFCFRACNPAGSNAPGYCQHVYDVMGCDWNMPASYAKGFDSCKADSGEPMGVYGGSTFHQGQAATPAAHPVPASSACTPLSTIGNGFLIQGTSIGSSTSAKATGSTPTDKNTGSSGSSGSSPNGPENSKGAASSITTSIQVWERLIMTVGSTLVLSLVGAAMVL